MMLLPLNNFTETWSIFILKGIFTSLISFMLLFLFKINKLLLILKKITITFESKINYFLFGILVVSFLGLYIVFYYNAFNKINDSFSNIYENIEEVYTFIKNNGRLRIDVRKN